MKTKLALWVFVIVVWVAAGWLFFDKIAPFIVEFTASQLRAPVIYHPAAIERQIIIRHAEWRDI
jgi:hypothetical protein